MWFEKSLVRSANVCSDGSVVYVSDGKFREVRLPERAIIGFPGRTMFSTKRKAEIACAGCPQFADETCPFSMSSAMTLSDGTVSHLANCHTKADGSLTVLPTAAFEALRKHYLLAEFGGEFTEEDKRAADSAIVDAAIY